MSNHNCHDCKASLKHSEKIVCSNPSCGKQYHYLCVNISAENHKKQRNWKCPSCTKTQLRDNNNGTPTQSLGPTNTVADCDNTTTRRHISQNTDLAKYVLRSEIANIIRFEIRNALNEEFTTMRQEIRHFEESLKFLSSQHGEVTVTLKTYAEEAKLLRNENNSLQIKIKDMESRLIQMEQDARQNNLEVNGLPEHKTENLTKMILQMSKVVSYPVSESEIIACTRVQKKNHIQTA
ncbi:unnamed protein product [Arctia plantaginis]|uniref:PHD-type domain-containing protein n=1 Tax=Arctia plantaginis TaxID=874455 RepID=A0A8S1A940_ARCPL|nr:unnamed protein product [Arctia plantaginis]